MKINVDVDLSPEELRRLFGLPDFTPTQELIVEALTRQVEKGLDGSLLPSMMRAVVEGGMQSFEAYQKLVTNLVSPARDSSGPSSSPSSSEEEGSASSSDKQD
jgi:hypothetical protein